MSILEDERRKQQLAAEARARGMEPWQLEMARGLDDKTVRGVVDDFRRGPSQPSGLAGPTKPEQVKSKGTGWQDQRPLESPPGVAILDKIMDQADAADRRRLEALERLRKDR
jgi:hypothetical protein